MNIIEHGKPDSFSLSRRNVDKRFFRTECHFANRLNLIKTDFPHNSQRNYQGERLQH